MKKDTDYCLAISVQKRVACALYELGSTNELRKLSTLFEMGVNTAGLIIHDFCNIIIDLLF